MEEIQLKLFDIPALTKYAQSFKRIQYPVWTERKAKLIQQYLYYFVLITKHGTYIDGFAGPQKADEQTRAKHEVAKRWCDAVSAWEEMGAWKFDVCKDPKKLNAILTSHA